MGYKMEPTWTLNINHMDITLLIIPKIHNVQGNQFFVNLQSIQFWFYVFRELFILNILILGKNSFKILLINIL